MLGSLWFFIPTVPYVGNLCSVNVDAMEDLDEMEVHLRSIDSKRNFCLRLSVAYCVLVQLCMCAPNLSFLYCVSVWVYVHVPMATINSWLWQLIASTFYSFHASGVKH